MGEVVFSMNIPQSPRISNGVPNPVKIRKKQPGCEYVTILNAIVSVYKIGWLDGLPFYLFVIQILMCWNPGDPWLIILEK